MRIIHPCGAEMPLDSIWSHRSEKIILILIFIIYLTLIYILTFCSPNYNGYELSIYEHISVSFWILLILISFFNSFMIYLFVIKYYTFSYVQNINLIVIVLIDVLILALPHIRGYYIYPGYDALNHLGYIKDIIDFGYISPSNYYPVIHIYGSIISQITFLWNRSLEICIYISWTLLYISGMYLLSKMLANDRNQAFLVILLSSPLLFSHFHTLIHPAIFSIFIIPLFLFFFHKRNVIEREQGLISIVLICLAILINFSHPVSSIYLIILLFSFDLSKLVYKILKNSTFNKEIFFNWVNDVDMIRLIIIILAIFIIWYFSFPQIQKNIYVVFLHIMSNSGESPFESHARLALLSGLDYLFLAKLIFFRYGGIIVYALLCIIGLIALAKKIRKHIELNQFVINYFVLLISATLFTLYSLFSYTFELSIIRVFRFFLLIAPIFSGLILYDFVKDSNKFKRFIIIFALFIIISISILNIYSSPRVADVNWQVTKMDILGSSWLGKYEDRSIDVIMGSLKLKNIEDYLYGHDSPKAIRSNIDKSLLPSALGYDTNETLSITFNYEKKYLLITKLDSLIYLILPKTVDYKYNYTDKDLKYIEQDIRVYKIYSNSEFLTYYVN